MLMSISNFILAAGLDMSSCQSATTATSEAGSSGLFGNMSGLLLPLAMIVVLLFVMIIPQRRRDKKVKEMLNALKPGDRVRTIGGIYGTISSVKVPSSGFISVIFSRSVRMTFFPFLSQAFSSSEAMVDCPFL